MTKTDFISSVNAHASEGEVFAPDQLNFNSKIGKLNAGFDAVYGEGRARDLKRTLRDKVDRGEVGPKNFALVDQLQAVVDEQKVAYKQLDNVLKQRRAVKDAKSEVTHEKKKLRPGRITKGIGERMSDSMGIVDEDIELRWDTLRSSHDSGKGPVYDPMMRRRERIEAIKNYSDDNLPFTGPPKGGYLRLLHDADVEASERNRLCADRITSLLNNGEDLSDERKSSYQTEIGNFVSGAKGAALSGLASATKFSNYMGSGMWSKTDPASNKNFKKYVQDRNDLLSNLVWQFSPNATQKGRILEAFKKVMQGYQFDANGMVDDVTFRKLMAAISDEIEENDKEMLDAIESLNKLNDELYDLAKNQTEKKDEMWKFRVLQGILLISPFVGVAALGPIFGAIGHIFELGIADGIAHLTTSDFLGPIGSLSEAIQFDDAVRWVLGDSPLLGDFVGVIDEVLTSNIGSELSGGVLAMTLGSPLASLGVAGVYSLFRSKTEIEFGFGTPPDVVKYSKVFKKRHQELEDEIYKIHKAGRTENNDFTGFVKKKNDLLRDCAEVESLVDFVFAMVTSECFDILGDDFLEFLQNNGVIEDGDLNYQTLRESLANLKDKEVDKYKHILDKLLLFRGLEYEMQKINRESGKVDPSFSQVIESLRERKIEDMHQGRLIEDGGKILSQEFDVEMAKSRNIEVNQAVFERRAEGSLDASGGVAKDLAEKVAKAESDYLSQQAEGKKEVTREEIRGYSKKPKTSVSGGCIASSLADFGHVLH